MSAKRNSVRRRRRSLASENVKPNSEEELRNVLEKHNVDTSAYGTAHAKTIGALYEETQRGEAYLRIDEHGKILRCVSIVLLEVRAGNKLLVETHQRRPDGQTRPRNVLLGSKRQTLPSGGVEDWKAVCARILRDSLCLSPKDIRGFNIHDDIPVDQESRQEFSKSYPGLMTVYERMRIVLHIEQHMMDSLQHIGLPHCHSFNSVNNWLEQSVQFWSWWNVAAYREREKAMLMRRGHQPMTDKDVFDLFAMSPYAEKLRWLLKESFQAYHGFRARIIYERAGGRVVLLKVAPFSGKDFMEQPVILKLAADGTGRSQQKEFTNFKRFSTCVPFHCGKILGDSILHPDGVGTAFKLELPANCWQAPEFEQGGIDLIVTLRQIVSAHYDAASQALKDDSDKSTNESIDPGLAACMVEDLPTLLQEIVGAGGILRKVMHPNCVRHARTIFDVCNLAPLISEATGAKDGIFSDPLRAISDRVFQEYFEGDLDQALDTLSQSRQKLQEFASSSSFNGSRWRPFCTLAHGRFGGSSLIVDIFEGVWLTEYDGVADEPALKDIGHLTTALLLEDCVLPVAAADLMSYATAQNVSAHMVGKWLGVDHRLVTQLLKELPEWIQKGADATTKSLNQLLEKVCKDICRDPVDRAESVIRLKAIVVATQEDAISVAMEASALSSALAGNLTDWGDIDKEPPAEVTAPRLVAAWELQSDLLRGMGQGYAQMLKGKDLLPVDTSPVLILLAMLDGSLKSLCSSNVPPWQKLWVLKHSCALCDSLGSTLKRDEASEVSNQFAENSARRASRVQIGGIDSRRQSMAANKQGGRRPSALIVGGGGSSRRQSRANVGMSDMGRMPGSAAAGSSLLLTPGMSAGLSPSRSSSPMAPLSEGSGASSGSAERKKSVLVMPGVENMASNDSRRSTLNPNRAVSPAAPGMGRRPSMASSGGGSRRTSIAVGGGGSRRPSFAPPGASLSPGKRRPSRAPQYFTDTMQQAKTSVPAWMEMKESANPCRITFAPGHRLIRLKKFGEITETALTMTELDDVTAVTVGDKNEFIPDSVGKDNAHSVAAALALADAGGLENEDGLTLMGWPCASNGISIEDGQFYRETSPYKSRQANTQPPHKLREKYMEICEKQSARSSGLLVALGEMESTDPIRFHVEMVSASAGIQNQESSRQIVVFGQVVGHAALVEDEARVDLHSSRELEAINRAVFPAKEPDELVVRKDVRSSLDEDRVLIPKGWVIRGVGADSGERPSEIRAAMDGMAYELPEIDAMISSSIDLGSLKEALSEDLILSQTVHIKGQKIIKGSTLLPTGSLGALRNKGDLDILLTEFPKTLTFRTFKAPGTLVVGKWKVKVHNTMSHICISQLGDLGAPDALMTQVVFNSPERKEVRVPLRVFDFVVHTPGTRIKTYEDDGFSRDGTVERLREDGMYRIRMDGESQSIWFDPERHNHTPAAVYRYGAGQKLLVHQRLADSNSWLEAVVVQPLADGNRHELEFVKDQRRKKQRSIVDLSGANHMPAWVSAQEFERLQKHYTQYLSTRYSFIVDVITGRHLDVFTQFVHLRIVAGAAEDVTAWSHLVASVQQSPRRYDGIHPNPCSIILGGPASGKTSFARQLVMLCIRTNNDFMPIFVAVIDLARKMKHYKFRGDLIDEYLKVTHGETTQRYIMLRQALYSRCAIIIADGIDEAGGMKPRIERYLVRLARGGHRVICTSRAEGYTPSLYPEGLFVTLELMPLQRQQQYWLAENRLGKQKAPQFLEQLDAHEDIAGNPLMYQMLLCYTEHYGVSSEATEALEIYTGVIRIMLNRVEICKGSQHGPEEVEKLLQIIALAAHCKRVRDFTDQDVIQLLHQKGSSIASKLRSTWEHIRSAIIEDRMPIVTHFTDSDVMYFRFSHLSFQEYFAACSAQISRQNHQATPLPAAEEIVFDGFWRKFLLFFFNQGSLAVTLSFPSGELSYEKVQILAMFLNQAKAIVKIHLGANLTGVDGPMGAKDLAIALRGNATLRHLDLEANCIGRDGASALAHALKTNSALQLLNLRNNSIFDGGASELAEALEVNHTLLNLNLRYNEIGPEGAKHLGEALQMNDGLIVLNLEANELGPEGAQFLAAGLRHNHTIQELRLRNNRIGSEGAQSLSSALKINRSLQLLDLETNRIGDGGAQSISTALQSHQQLQHLNLRGNTIGREGSKYLSKMLDKNRSLRRLDLQDNDLGAKQCMKLKKQWGAMNINADGSTPWSFSNSMQTIDNLLKPGAH